MVEENLSHKCRLKNIAETKNIWVSAVTGCV